jgi:drug/metabolite transporter (DMT)-like permease
MNSSLLGLIFGLASALIWGGGDFSGGMAARRTHTIQVMALTSFAGLVAMLGLALLTGETWLGGIDFAWAGAAGMIGALGIVALFYGLSKRAAAIVAPTSAVVGTAVPVLVSALLEGLPGPAQMAGILVGAAGIWLVARQPGPITPEMRRLFWLAAGSGVCFGTFFVFIAQVQSESLFVPLTISKTSASLTALLLLGLRRLPLPNVRRNPLALLAGLMDTGGNVFYLLAARYTRMDIAAVLASMGPAVTVLLSAIILREKIGWTQGLGVLLCIGATILLAL